MKGLTRCAFLRFVALGMLAAAFSAAANTIVWSNPNGGNWSASANWTPHHAPAAGDTAVITNTGNYTVTLDVSPSVSGVILGSISGSTQTLLLNGQTLSLNGSVTINAGGQLNLVSGTLNGVTNGIGAVVTGPLTCSGAALSGVITLASNAVINLVGTMASNTFSSPLVLTNYGTITWSNSELYGQGGLQIYNYGLWDAQTDNTFHGNSTLFYNPGTFRKSAGTATTVSDAGTTFYNSGLVDAESGTLLLQSGSGGGAFNCAEGTILGFGANSSYTLLRTPAFTGSGLVTGRLGSGDATLSGTLTCSGLTFSGIWTNSAECVMNLTGLLGTNMFNCIMANYGAVYWDDSDLFCFDAVVNNYGLWEAQADGTFWGTAPDHTGPQSYFNNAGTFRKSGGAGNTSFDSANGNMLLLDNTGTVEVDSGTLLIRNVAGDATGTFITTSGTTINFSPGCYFILRGDNTLTGDGMFTGSLQCGSVFNAVLHGTMNLSGVSFSGLAFSAGSDAVVNFLGALGPVSFGVGFTNFGTVRWSGGDVYAGPVIDNYGLWEATTDNTLSGGVFNNYGTLRKSGTTGFQTVLGVTTIFTNYGTVDVQAGLLVLAGNKSFADGSVHFGIDSATNFGSMLLVTGGALAGTLSVSLNGGYVPAAGDAFALLMYPAESGTFGTLNLPHLSPSLTWQVEYGASALTLSVVPLPPPRLSTSFSGSSLSLSWDAVAGQSYQVQYATNLVPAYWTDLGGAIPGTNGTLTVTGLNGPDSQRFYRLTVLP